jgi:predicted dehydrogenase
MGIRGSLFSRVITERSDAELVGVTDIDPRIVALRAAQFSTKGYNRFEEMLDREAPDVLCVTTPDFAHTPMVLEAAKRGIHLIVEKPLTTTLEDCERIRQAVAENGVQCLVAFAFRWAPYFMEPRRAIAAGELGEVVGVRTNVNDTIFVPTQMISWSERTSPAWFLASHSLDQVFWLTGKTEVESVYATGVKKVLVSMGIDSFDSIRTLIRFKDGTDAYVGCCWVLPDSMPRLVDFEFEVIGTKGTVQVDTHFQMVREMTDRYTFPDISSYELGGKLYGEHVFCLNAFIDCIKNGTAPPVTLEEAIRVSSVLAAVHESLETDSVVALGS